MLDASAVRPRSEPHAAVFSVVCGMKTGQQHCSVASLQLAAPAACCCVALRTTPALFAKCTPAARGLCRSDQVMLLLPLLLLHQAAHMLCQGTTMTLPATRSVPEPPHPQARESTLVSLRPVIQPFSPG
jgi:hypothetical protein